MYRNFNVRYSIMVESFCVIEVLDDVKFEIWYYKKVNGSRGIGNGG